MGGGLQGKGGGGVGMKGWNRSGELMKVCVCVCEMVADW